MLERKRDFKAWLYIGIPIFLLGVFTFYPLIKTVLISFSVQYNPLGIGLIEQFGVVFNFDAYISVLSFPRFLTVLYNTLLIVFISVPVSTVLSILIAVALNSIKPLQKIFQSIFFLPYVTNTLAIGMVFSVLFDQNEGLINLIFNSNTNWIDLGAETWRWTFVVLLYTIWNGLPFKILVFIGGLQSISKQYYDAAKIDSTPKSRVLTKITIPLLSPTISYILITSFIGAFKTYEAVIGVFTNLTNEQVRNRTTIVGFIYEMIGRTGGYAPYEDPTAVASYYSRGAAAAVILFVIILIFTLINLYISNRKVVY
ncbi:MAG: sugar ABC transporter permease [Acholeplasmatales bacterium]|jgi:multiple sugar transport system permease protein|nr:sugar ABC transporter permease [Acholeplasmatales bacterium]